MSSPQAYPLSWPLGYPRAKFRAESRFRKSSRESRPGNYVPNRRHTIAEATRFLSDELDRLGATSVLLSTNLQLKLDGTPRGAQSAPIDTGACVYFKLNGRPMALPCDKWQHVECNIYAIGKHIEALRGQDRWGVGSIERAFAGYLALEAQTMPKWFEILAVLETASKESIETARRNLIRKYHPDGTEPNAEKFHQVSEAYRIAMELRR